MRWHHCVLIFAALFSSSAMSHAEDRVFEGPWNTTNRKLDGIMTAVVKDLGDDQWQGRFYGVWQGVPFDYTVKFSGKPESLKGAAVIDFADYTWIGKLRESEGKEPAVFKGSFGGSRYTGFFTLKETTKPTNPPVITATKPVTTAER